MRLRELALSDVNGMLEWMHDPDINCFYRFDGSSFTARDAGRFIVESLQDVRNRHYAVVSEQDEYLGTVSLKSIDGKDKTAEYAIALRKKVHGTGISTAATDQVLAVAFNELGLNRVYLNVMSDNTRAVSFYRKYGFICEGTFRQHICVRGIYHDLSWFSMLKNEYMERHAHDNGSTIF